MLFYQQQSDMPPDIKTNITNSLITNLETSSATRTHLSHALGSLSFAPFQASMPSADQMDLPVVDLDDVDSGDPERCVAYAASAAMAAT